MLHDILLGLGVSLLVCGVAGFVSAIMTFMDDGNVAIIFGLFSLLIAIIGLLICFFIYEPLLCPGCHTEVSSNVRYCEACGYELIPHCIECGEVCKTAFCKLCGAEQ